MSDETQTEFPNEPGGSEPRPDRPILLEGMKVLFDDKVGLFPVTLVATPGRRESRPSHGDG